MSETVISVEGLGKRYRIGAARERYVALRDVLTRGASSIGRRLTGRRQERPSFEEFWALKDVSFEVRQGECVGIIGRNGAGKSTLLKLLSRITEPTEGRFRIRGRVASLLEVGTGFHPELTGRENVYLNGSILGMNRKEIDRKFDEIVAFAEVEKFLDTPVKYFSSGMYMRLAFAVAAHLEPEVLVVDEVLAVGDAAFQKKCLGKMDRVSRQDGRTVLFVSHNMAAVKSLCGRGVLLERGRLGLAGAVGDVLHCYHQQMSHGPSSAVWVSPDQSFRSDAIAINRAYLTNQFGELTDAVDFREAFFMVIEYEVFRPIMGNRIGVMISNQEGCELAGSTDYNVYGREMKQPGRYTSRCQFPGHVLNSGDYFVRVAADLPPYASLEVDIPECLRFTVVDDEGHGPGSSRLPGVIRPKLVWTVASADQNGSPAPHGA